MSDVHETRTIQADSASTFPRLPEPWKPENDFEEALASSLRVLSRAKSGYEVGRISPLTEEQQTSYEATKRNLITDIQKVIKAKESARLGAKDLLQGIGLVHDGVHAIISVPSESVHHPTRQIFTPIEVLDEEYQRALPPISEEAVIKGLEKSDEDVNKWWYVHRHDPNDDSWQKFQAASKIRAQRFIAVIKNAGELPNINWGLAEDIETVTITLPPTANRTEPLPVEATIKDLESLNPGVRSLLG